MDNRQSLTLIQKIRHKAMTCPDRDFGKDILELINEYEILRDATLRIERALHNMIKKIEMESKTDGKLGTASNTACKQVS